MTTSKTKHFFWTVSSSLSFFAHTAAAIFSPYPKLFGALAAWSVLSALFSFLAFLHEHPFPYFYDPLTILDKPKPSPKTLLHKLKTGQL
jgi:hypothetical protein